MATESFQHKDTKDARGGQTQRNQLLGTTQISLTAQETRLRDLLLDVGRFIDESKEIKEQIELRFAGGWVRDKLLGIPSNDIDTTINAMTGSAYCLKMKEFLQSQENLTKHGLEPKDVGSLHKIAANPDKSKHLETATIKISGLDVDFVNLRKETYAADSRTPQMEFGTAQEDALRRDATINALFYNLRTDQVEDFVGGLPDMDKCLVKTPLEPHQTFMDDPLRVLRLIRFASRLDFSIDHTCEEYMSEAEVLEALRLKISRERVGIEVEKMLYDKNPRNALQYIDRLGLYDTIFTDPTNSKISSPSTGSWHRAYACLSVMRENASPQSLYQILIRTKEAAYLAWVLAALVPWAEAPHLPSKPGAKPSIPVATIVAREGIRQTNRTCEFVTGAVTHMEEITQLKNSVKTKASYIHERDRFGMAIRRWDAKGDNWRAQIILAILVEAQHAETDDYSIILNDWQLFMDHLDELEIMDGATWHRLVDGKMLQKALGIKPGQWMKDAMDVCMAWQFRNPGVKDPTGAIEEVRSRATELGIPLENISQ